MKKVFSLVLTLVFAVGILTGCNSGDPDARASQEAGGSSSSEVSASKENTDASANENQSNGVLQVVATNSILADIAMNVGGDCVEVYSIVPVGTDPHEYEPLPADIQSCEDADIVLYNGLNLETGNGWFTDLMETTGKTQDKDFYAVSDGVEAQHLTTEGQEGEEDPHAWLDIQNGIIYSENMAKIFSDHDPGNTDTYAANCETYTAELSKLDQDAKNKFSDIPEEKRLLVTSEGAFKYFSKAYGLTAAYIWEINTESQGTPAQMTNIIDTINEREVPVLFVETSVDSRSMEQISEETGLPIYSTIFTDSLAAEGEEGDTYYTMMKWNLDKIHEGLSQ